MTYRTHAGFSVHLQAMTSPRELADRLELHGRADDLNALAEDGKRLKHSEREAIEAIQTVAMQAAQMLRTLADQQERDAKDAERLEWLWRMLPGALLRTMFGHLSDTGDMKIARTAIDAARTAQEPKT